MDPDGSVRDFRQDAAELREPLTVREVMRRDVAVVGPDDRVSDALRIMLWRNLRYLPVVEGRALLGIVSEQNVLRARLSAPSFYGEPRHTVGDVMSGPAQLSHPRMEVATAAAVMSVHGIGCLPVVDQGRVVGLVTASDLLAHLARGDTAPERGPAPAGSATPVRTRMVRVVATVHAEDRLLDAAARMMELGTRYVTVLDPFGRVVGVLSERDLRSALGDPRRLLEGESSPNLATKPVAAAMQPAPTVLREDDPLDRALETMIDGRLAALPVVDRRGGLVGLLSYVDLLRGPAARSHRV